MSLFSEPLVAAPANPDPNSTPFTDGIEYIAFAKSDSIESNTGSPTPAGTPLVRISRCPQVQSHHSFYDEK